MPTSHICIDCGRTVDRVRRSRCDWCLHAYNRVRHAREGDRTGRDSESRRAHQAIITSPEWRRVSKQVRLRDGACVDCGTRESLTAHHVIPARVAPELALDPDNCVTLCRSCHGRREARGA